MKKICVLGSGTVRVNSPVYKQAEKLGRALACAGFSVCHGGYGGVMEAVARGAKQSGGRNIGITIARRPASMPRASSRRHGVEHRVLTSVNPYADGEIKMPSWEKRLLKLIEIGDAYVFLDGATGTLNELFFVWEMANRGLHAKPIILLGRRLHQLVQFLGKDESLKIPENFYQVVTVRQVIKHLIGCRG